MNKDEYSELCTNLRHYHKMQFAELTVFLGVTAALLKFVYASDVPQNLILIFKIMGSIVSFLFFIVDTSNMHVWDKFIKRASELEKSMNYKQYSSLLESPKFRIRPAKTAVSVFHLIVLAFWMMQIIIKV